MTRPTTTIQLGFEVGTGKPVEIPLAHTFVTGQTQLSGKTTTLRAIVERSGQRALAFVTKRGESFDGRRIRPYLPREGDRPLHWRQVETLMAAAMGQRNMKWERGAIVTATKGASTLADVRANVARLRDKTKNPKTEELYMLLGEYLDLVLPELEALGAAPTLALEPGLNVMDLAEVTTQTQAWVIRAALEHVNRHERGVLTVFPEAWEFAPRGRGGPAKDEAIAMARKGAVLGNFLLCDSQDLAGVDTVIRQGASVWILGVQRELNELKRTVQMIPAGIARPKPEDIATLELGQFYACFGRNAVKTYVQPVWMDPGTAVLVAESVMTVEEARREQPTRQEDPTVTNSEAARLTRENEQLKADNADLRRRLEALEKGQHDGTRSNATSGEGRTAARGGRTAAHGTPAPGRAVASQAVRTFTAEESLDNEALYQAIKKRLIAECATDPVLLRLLTTVPAIEVQVTRKTIQMDEFSLKGRIARLIKEGFFREPRGCGAVRAALKRTGPDANTANIGRALDDFTRDGFVTDEGSGYREVAGMTINILEG